MLSLQTQASLTAGGLVAGSKFLRLTLQSLALGLGAFLAIRGSISIGSVFAASFLAGRALQPIDQVLSAWPTLVRPVRPIKRSTISCGATRHRPL